MITYVELYLKRFNKFRSKSKESSFSNNKSYYNKEIKSYIPKWDRKKGKFNNKNNKNLYGENLKNIRIRKNLIDDNCVNVQFNSVDDKLIRNNNKNNLKNGFFGNEISNKKELELLSDAIINKKNKEKLYKNNSNLNSSNSSNKRNNSKNSINNSKISNNNSKYNSKENSIYHNSKNNSFNNTKKRYNKNKLNSSVEKYCNKSNLNESNFSNNKNWKSYSNNNNKYSKHSINNSSNNKISPIKSLNLVSNNKSNNFKKIISENNKNDNKSEKRDNIYLISKYNEKIKELNANFSKLHNNISANIIDNESQSNIKSHKTSRENSADILSNSKRKNISSNASINISNSKKNNISNNISKNVSKNISHNSSNNISNSNISSKNIDKTTIPNYTKNEVIQKTHIIFLKNAQFLPNKNSYFINEEKILKILKKINIIPNQISKNDLDIIYKNICGNNKMCNYDQFIKIIIQIIKKILPDEFKIDSRTTTNCFFHNMFEEYKDILENDGGGDGKNENNDNDYNNENNYRKNNLNEDNINDNNMKKKHNLNSKINSMTDSPKFVKEFDRNIKGNQIKDKQNNTSNNNKYNSRFNYSKNNKRYNNNIINNKYSNKNGNRTNNYYYSPTEPNIQYQYECQSQNPNYSQYETIFNHIHSPSLSSYISTVPTKGQIFILSNILHTITEIYKIYFSHEINKFPPTKNNDIQKPKSLISFCRDFELLPFLINETNIANYYVLSVNYNNNNTNNNTNEIPFPFVTKNIGHEFTLNHFLLFLLHMSFYSYSKLYSNLNNSKIPSPESILILFLGTLESSKGLSKLYRKLCIPRNKKISLVPDKEILDKLNKKLIHNDNIGGIYNDNDMYNINDKNNRENNRKYRNERDIWDNVNNIKGGKFGDKETNRLNLIDKLTVDSMKILIERYKNNENNNNDKIDDFDIDFNLLNIELIMNNYSDLKKTFLYFSRIGDKINYDQMGITQYFKFLYHCSLIFSPLESNNAYFEKIRNDLINKRMNDKEDKRTYLNEKEKEYVKLMGKITNTGCCHNEQLGECDVNIIFYYLTGIRNFDKSEYYKKMTSKNSGYSEFSRVQEREYKAINNFQKFDNNFFEKNEQNFDNFQSNSGHIYKLNFKKFLLSFQIIAQRIYPDIENKKIRLNNLLEKYILPNLIKEEYKE